MPIQVIKVLDKSDKNRGKIYRFEGITKAQAIKLKDEVLTDPVTQVSEVNPDNSKSREVGYKPGVTDPIENSLIKAANLFGIYPAAVSTSEISGRSPSQIERVIKEEPKTLIFKSTPRKTEIIKIRNLTDSELSKLSQKRSLYLNLEEMKVIQLHYKKLKRDPTDLELEVFAQTWSEHCYHKTFKAILVDENGKQYEPLISRIKKASEKYFDKAEVVSAFSDNAGGMKFYEDYVIVGKGETHNSPVAIDPYGGSLTKNGGVYRDIVGFGKGADNIASFMVNNFASPETSEEYIPKGVLNPKYLLLQNSRGEREYGNPMGIPTHGITLHFHKNFAPKPTSLGVVIGITKEEYVKKDEIKKGDLIITIGGKTGRDGVHGATFSSGEMTTDTSDVHSTAVQLGDPITEKAAFDAIREARDKSLIKSITDCGAGGYSSAIGEMANGVGAEVNLENIPIKYEGLSPWELFLSESQERMVLAIDPENLDKFNKIADKYYTHLVVLGTFTGDNYLTVKYKGEIVGRIDLKFLHKGLPQRKMIFKKQNYKERPVMKRDIHETLSDLNISSKEEMHRMYDMTVGAMTAMAPFVGKLQDVPTEASVLTPFPEKSYGIVSSYAVNPLISLVDPYKGATWAFVHAAAKFTAAGGDIDHACGIDNFIWPFPDEESLYGLHRATEALVEAINVFGIPMVSGKDSLSSTFRSKEGKVIKAPPSLCITLFGKIPDIEKTITPDFKSPNSTVCVVGNYIESSLEEIRENLKVVRDAISTGLVKSAKAVGEEGIVAGLCQMCMGSDGGGEFNLSKEMLDGNVAGVIVVEVESEDVARKIFKDSPYKILGKTTVSKTFKVKGIVDEDIDSLKKSWKKPFFDILDERVKVAVLAAPGVNRDFATKNAFELAGARADIVHISELKSDKNILVNYQIFSIPGGFSYGDHIQSGRVLALELLNANISKQIRDLLERGGLVLGVCNGFQALVQCGLLPFGKFHTLSQNKTTLTNNLPNRFQSRWIHLKPVSSVCKFVKLDSLLNIPVASGEGRFMTTDEDTINKIRKNKQIVFQYCESDGRINSNFPINPNGSVLNIAGICDPSGQILGMMPHAEDFVRREHHPNWRRMDKNMSIDGLKFFQNIVSFAR